MIRKALWKENVLYPSVNDRHLLHQLWGGREGRMNNADFLAVSGSFVGMTYSLDVGRAVVKNDNGDGKEMYFVENDAPVVVSHDAGDSTNPRIDLLCIKIADSEITGSSDLDQVVVLKGTPAFTPAEPVIPSDATYFVLWAIRIPVGASSITPTQFTDRRVPVSALAGTTIWVADPADRDLRITPYAYRGMQVWRNDVSRAETWVGAWVMDVRHDVNGDSGIVRDFTVGRNLNVVGGISGPTISALSAAIGSGGLRVYGGDLNYVPLGSTPDGIWICNTNANASYGTLISFKAAGGAVQFAVTYGIGDSNDPAWAYASARTFNGAMSDWGPWYRLF